MKSLNITINDINSLCEVTGEDLYDNYWIECSTKYINKLKKQYENSLQISYIQNYLIFILLKEK